MDEEHETNFVDVETEEGTKQSISVRSRWSSHIWHWDDKNPEQKTADVLRIMLTIFLLMIVIMVIVRRDFMNQSSVLLYVIGNQWRRGLNIFAFTAVFLLIIAAALVVTVVRWLLKMLSRVLGPRGETVTRLLLNFVEYISVLAVLFESLSILGFDTKSLLASAGILALVIGLGAQNLITDIIAGLFIIFDGEFRVGDVITINGVRGTVREVGVRTTKIVDGDGNVKIINNRQITDVLNMTMQDSVCVIEACVANNQDVDSLRDTINLEYRGFAEKNPIAHSDPVFGSVTSIKGAEIKFTIVTSSREQDRPKVQAAMMEHLVWILKKYDLKAGDPNRRNS